MSKNYSPISIFVYKRLKHLKIALNSLKKNAEAKKSTLYIFSDHWKSEKDKASVLEVRKYLSTILGFKKKVIIYRKKNFGLSKNIINGINYVLKYNNKIIVLEDDLKLNRYFLKYMNYNLNYFEKNNKIASIHGYMYPIKFRKNIPDYFFIKGADCWGWGTWRRAWKKFDSRGLKLKKMIDQKKNKKDFNFDNSIDYYQMLINQINRKNNSWAIRWYASAFVNNMLTLYPKKTFVKNIGRDNSGTHGSGTGLQIKETFRKRYIFTKHSIRIREHLDAKKELISYFKKTSDNFFIKLIKIFYYLVS
jgi:hypothetical protein